MTTNKTSFDEKPPILFVPGGVNPVELSYGPLLAVIKDQVRPILKELEIYATDTPPSDYGLELEVEGIRRVADSSGVKSFHLVGFSAGGASSLAFTSKYPERLRSLALIEPAWIGSVSPEDAEQWAELEHIMTFPPDQRLPAFIRWQLRSEARSSAIPTPPGPPPPWMAKRPAGLEAIARAFNTYKLDQQPFRMFNRPVYYALGSLTTRFYEHEAKTLSGLFPDMRVEEYEGRSHFDPPQRAEPKRLSRALMELWARGEGVMIDDRKSIEHAAYNS